MPKGFCKHMKQAIASVITYFEKKRDNNGSFLPLKAVHLRLKKTIKFLMLQKAAVALSISISSVSEIHRCMNANEHLAGPSGKIVRPKPVRDIDHATEISICNVIYEMYCTNQHITRDSLLQLFKENDVFNGSTTSLGLILKSIGFQWKKNDLCRGLMELPRIAMARVDILQKYVSNVNSNYFRQFVYVDETWIFEDGTVNWSWQDLSLETVKKLKSEGKRYIVLHTGNVNGFIEGGSLVFSSNTKDLDYHGKMNEANFLKWFAHQFLRNLDQPSMIIMDNASYHSTILNKSPTSNCRKGDIQQWLSNQGITFEENLLKLQLLQLVALHKPPKMYVANTLAEQHGHKVLLLLPYHCVFNQVENVWGIAKTYYNRHIGRDGRGVEDCIKMWEEALSKITKETWVETIEHTEKEIKKWWVREVEFDRNDTQFLINLNEDSDSECDTDTDHEN